MPLPEIALTSAHTHRPSALRPCWIAESEREHLISLALRYKRGVACVRVLRVGALGGEGVHRAALPVLYRPFPPLLAPRLFPHCSQAPAEQIQAVEARHVEDDGGAKPKGGAGGKHRKAPRKVAH